MLQPKIQKHRPKIVSDVRFTNLRSTGTSLKKRCEKLADLGTQCGASLETARRLFITAPAKTAANQREAAGTCPELFPSLLADWSNAAAVTDFKCSCRSGQTSVTRQQAL